MSTQLVDTTLATKSRGERSQLGGQVTGKSGSVAEGKDRQSPGFFNGGKGMRLKDRVAVITGSGAGIGRACAMEFAKQGARLIVADTRSLSEIDFVVRRINNLARFKCL